MSCLFVFLIWARAKLDLHQHLGLVFLVFFFLKFPVNHKLPSPTAAQQIDVPVSFMAHTSNECGGISCGGIWGSEHHPSDAPRSSCQIPTQASPAKGLPFRCHPNSMEAFQVMKMQRDF